MSAVFQGLRINSDPVDTMIIAIIICIYIFFVVFVKILFIIDSNPSDLLYFTCTRYLVQTLYYKTLRSAKPIALSQRETTRKHFHSPSSQTGFMLPPKPMPERSHQRALSEL